MQNQANLPVQTSDAQLRFDSEDSQADQLTGPIAEVFDHWRNSGNQPQSTQDSHLLSLGFSAGTAILGKTDGNHDRGRDYQQFSVNVADTRTASDTTARPFEDLFQSDRPLASRIRSLVGNSNNGSQTDAVNRAYARNSISGLVPEYGNERMDALVSEMQLLAGSGELRSYNFTFGAVFGNTPEQNQERIDRITSNLREFLEPGGVEQLAELRAQLKADGFRGSMDPLRWDRRFVNMIATEPLERQAFIRMHNEGRESMAPANFVRDNPQYAMNNERPTEVWEAYQRWRRENP